MENAPSLVKRCYQSVKENLFEWEIILITKDNYKQYVDVIKMNYHPRLNHHIKHLDGDHLKAIIQKADKHHHLNRLTMDIFPLIDYIYSFYYVYYDILEFVLDYEDMHDNRIETFFHINMSILRIQQIMIIL